MASRRLLPVVAVGLAIEAAAACGGGATSKPVVTGVTPSIGDHVQGTTTLYVTGSGFERRLLPDADNPSHSSFVNPRIVFTTTSGSYSFPLTVTSASETSLTATITPSQIPIAGYYDVSVVNPDGPSSVKPKSYFMRGPVALVIGNGVGLATTSALLPVQVFDGQGNLTGLWNDLTITPSAVANTSLFGAPITIPANNTQGTLVVYDHVAPQVVTVTTVASNLAISPGVASFDPGPPFWVRVPSATKSPVDGKTHVVLRVEDAFRNLTPTPTAYSSLLQTPSFSCASATVNPGTMTIPAGATTSGEFTVSSVTTGCYVTVHSLENGTSTGYLSSDGNMSF